MAEIYLAGGCFWGPEFFSEINGVILRAKHSHETEGAVDTNIIQYKSCRNSLHVTYDETVVS